MSYHPLTPEQRLERFMRRVEMVTESGCWVWMGAVRAAHGRSDERPMMTVNYQPTYAHRYAYEAFVGPIPDGRFVCHHCDVPLCVNPAHLYAGTPLDNMLDRKRRNRFVSPKGEAQVGAKLTDALVEEIHRTYVRQCRINGTGGLAKRLGIDQSTVNRILHGTRWAHVLKRRRHPV